MAQVKAESLRPQNGVIFIAKRTDLVIDVWKGLVRHNFLSVPVLQKTGNKYYGFIDLADILLYVVEHFGKVKLESSEDYWKLVEEDDLFKKRTVNDLMVYPINRRNPFHPLLKGFSLFSAMEALAREKGLHRVPVIDENRKLVGLITQSHIIEFLHKYIGMIGSKKDKPVGHCKDAIRNVWSIHEDQMALDAFRMMSSHGVNGLAVVNTEGKLVGNISVRDLKAIGTDGRMFTRLNQSIKNFLPKLKKDFGSEDRPHKAVTLKPTDTIESAIRMLVTNKVHRLYIIDDAKKPIGIMSLKDVLMNIIEDNNMMPTGMTNTSM